MPRPSSEVAPPRIAAVTNRVHVPASPSLFNETARGASRR